MSFEEMLKGLRRDYLSSIPEKIKSIEGFVASQDVNNLREAFHKLKGTGRTYGIPEVSDLSEVVETICLTQPSNAVPAAALAVAVLRDVYQAYNTQAAYDLAGDTRMPMIRKLLQK